MVDDEHLCAWESFSAGLFTDFLLLSNVLPDVCSSLQLSLSWRAGEAPPPTPFSSSSYENGTTLLPSTPWGVSDTSAVQSAEVDGRCGEGGYEKTASGTESMCVRVAVGGVYVCRLRYHV